MTVALVVVSCLWFLSLVGCGLIVRTLIDRYDAQLRAMADRVQAPQAASLAAMEQIAPRQHEATSDWEPVPVEGDLYIDDILDRVGAP